jgi:ElaB/YqjD/DUF883 family membrane-anchored ribosome-binding protein
MEQSSMEGSSPGASSAADHARDIAQRAQSTVTRLKDSAQSTASRLGDAASTAADRLSAKSEELMALQARMTDTARIYIREHPFATIAIAIAIGMILSRLTSRR